MSLEDKKDVALADREIMRNMWHDVTKELPSDSREVFVHLKMHTDRTDRISARERIFKAQCVWTRHGKREWDFICPDADDEYVSTHVITHWIDIVPPMGYGV